jgi:hypothetical protein
MWLRCFGRAAADAENTGDKNVEPIETIMGLPDLIGTIARVAVELAPDRDRIRSIVSDPVAEPSNQRLIDRREAAAKRLGAPGQLGHLAVTAPSPGDLPNKRDEVERPRPSAEIALDLERLVAFVPGQFGLDS